MRVCVDGSAAAAVERAIEQVRSTRRAGEDTDEHRAAQAALDLAREQVAEATFGFEFRGLSAKERSDMIAAHPSPNKDEAWDTETLPPALVAACAADPIMTAEQAADLMNRLAEGDRAALFNAAWSVNFERSPVPFS